MDLKIELKEASIEDSLEVWKMLQEIGPGESGFGNPDYNMSQAEFLPYLENKVSMAKGINLPTGYVPMTTYWLMANNYPVGISKLRHCLNDALKKEGGHIGYSIRPTERGKGYGTKILRETLKKAKQMNIDKVLLTTEEENIGSQKVIKNCNGQLEKTQNNRCNYWINI